MNKIRMRRNVVLLAGLFLAGIAQADEERFVVTNDRWKAECGSCHLAYPPQLLPASSWSMLFAGLGDHFGSDATLDPATATQLLAYAKSNAARPTDTKPPLRVTETRWFRHEHDEVGAATWTNPKVGSAANCAACHQGAERGDFDEDLIRIPR
ncbi:MAG: diheme cytochrome c [Sinimarinibacterium sp.]|jgi:hypothetical protein